MLRHHFILSLRTLWRNKFHSAINITGLAIGVSACLIIYLIVNFELSFNRDMNDYDRIYRIHSKFSGVYSGLNRGVPTAILPYVKDNFKGVDKVALFNGFGTEVKIPTPEETKTIGKQEYVTITDPQYFEVFSSYEWIVGSPDVLLKPYQTVLTENQAKKYFGDIPMSSVIGKEVIYSDSLITHVAGVVRDLPFNTDLKLTDFISQATIDVSWLKHNYDLTSWENISSRTQLFVKVSPGISEEMFAANLTALSNESKKHQKEGSDWSNNFGLQPFSDLHYNNAKVGIFDFSREAAHLPTLITLIFIALLLLVIGAINFINLETAQAVRRAKEVGVRKVLGSTRKRLIIQFLIEGLLLTLIAIMLSIPLTEFGLAYFSEFVPEGVTLNLTAFIPFLICIVFFIGILASAYPAFVLSSFLPALALKNQVYSGRSSGTAFLRKVLIVFQFTFAQALIIATLVIGWQIRFLLNKDLGFKKEAVVYFNTPWWSKKGKILLLKNELESLSEITEISLSMDPPASNGWSSNTIKYHNGKTEVSINTMLKFGDHHYIDFYGIELLAGRNLLASDTVRELILNETLMKQLGFKDTREAIGALLDYRKLKLPVVGIVKDFHTKSLHNKVEPVIMANNMKNFSCINLKLATNEKDSEALKAGLDKIEAAWKKIYPDTPLEYHFLDETIRNFYQTEQRTEKLTRTAMGLAIFISCLGLFGLASYTTVQRTKEIGIRKVLGASVQNIVLLLSRDFMFLVMIAFIIATPVAWLASDKWLQGFSYRTEISTWMFVLTGVLAFIVAFITISFKTIRAANSNPVNSLRSE